MYIIYNTMNIYKEGSCSMEVVIIIIAIVLLLVGIIVTALITKNVAIEQYKKSEEVKVGNAGRKSTRNHR